MASVDSENTSTVHPDIVDTEEPLEEAAQEENTMSLPLSKIKKVFKMDPEYAGASASAVYATGAATELFVQYLVEQASMSAKAEKRKKIQYRDVSSAVSAQESLYFLSDTVPRTQTVEKALKSKTINVSEEDQKKYRSLIGDEPADVSEQLQTKSPVAPSAPEPEKKPVLSKGQTTLPFQSAPSKETKKAGLLDLIDVESEQQQEPDAMVVDG